MMPSDSIRNQSVKLMSRFAIDITALVPYTNCFTGLLSV